MVQSNDRNMLCGSSRNEVVVTASTKTDMPLSHLPLRPSTLDLLTAAGFVRTIEVEESYRAGGIMNFTAELSSAATSSLTTTTTTTPAQAYSMYREVMDAITAVTTTSSVAIEQHTSIATTATTTSSAMEILHMQQYRCGGSNNSSSSSNHAIITFCRTLDMILGGGIALGELTEIAGAPGSGKTALSTQLAVNAALPTTVGGVAGGTIYIDTEGSFCPERCHCLATHLIGHIQSGLRKRQQQQNTTSSSSKLVVNWNVTADEILDNIHVYRAHDICDLITIVNYAIPDHIQKCQSTDAQQQQPPIRLIIIDSIAFPFRAATDPDTTDFVSRTRQLTTIAATLSNLAATYQIAVVTINQMTTKFISTHDSSTNTMSSPVENSNNNNVVSTTSKLVPALGESWAHAVTTRLILSYDEGRHQRLATLAKSPRLPEGTATFTIVEAGVRGAEYKAAKRQRTEASSRS